MQTQAQPRETVFFSRYPGEPIIEPPVLRSIPLSPRFVSIHDHALTAGRFLVFFWAKGAAGDWMQLGRPEDVGSIDEAREFVPPGAELVPSPAGWAREVYEVRS